MKELRGQANAANLIDSKLACPILYTSTAHRIVLFKEELSIHVAKHHRLSNGELLRTHAKVCMNHNQCDQSHTGQPVQNIDQSPGHISKNIGIPHQDSEVLTCFIMHSPVTITARPEHKMRKW